MDHLSATKKLFHAIVVMGMATSLGSLGCSSDSTSITDASADATGMDAANTKDSMADAKVEAGNDGGDNGDGFSGWLGC